MIFCNPLKEGNQTLLLCVLVTVRVQELVLTVGETRASEFLGTKDLVPVDIILLCAICQRTTDS